MLGIGLLSVLCGLLAGLYRGRHQRGSLDEVFGVATAGGLMLVPLVLLSGLLVDGQRDAVQTVAGGTLIALPTIAVARYVLYAARQRRAKTRPTAGSQGDRVRGRRRGHRADHPAAGGARTRPTGRSRCSTTTRTSGGCGCTAIPVLGDRTRMAEVAAATGATVLVIAIAEGERDRDPRPDRAGRAVRADPEGGADDRPS